MHPLLRMHFLITCQLRLANHNFSAIIDVDARSGGNTIELYSLQVVPSIVDALVITDCGDCGRLLGDNHHKRLFYSLGSNTLGNKSCFGNSDGVLAVTNNLEV